MTAQLNKGWLSRCLTVLGETQVFLVKHSATAKEESYFIVTGGIGVHHLFGLRFFSYVWKI